MKNLKRLFTTYDVKGTKNYLNSQKKYEVIRTILYFGISLSLFFAGILTTHTRKNLLTLVAVLGCLPASKSLIGTFMFLRYKSLPMEMADKIETHVGNLFSLYDCVFTSNVKNFEVGHLVIRGNTIAGLYTKKKYAETDCEKHLNVYLKADGYKDITVKIFSDEKKYMERIDQMRQLPEEEKLTRGIAETLKSIAL